MAKRILGKVRLKAIGVILDLHSSVGQRLLAIESHGVPPGVFAEVIVHCLGQLACLLAFDHIASICISNWISSFAPYPSLPAGKYRSQVSMWFPLSSPV